jgi:hypothetical protein
VVVGDVRAALLDRGDLVEEIGRLGVGQQILGLPVRGRGLQELQELSRAARGEKRARVWKRRQRGRSARATANGERDAEGVASSGTATEPGGVRFI